MERKKEFLDTGTEVERFAGSLLGKHGLICRIVYDRTSTEARYDEEKDELVLTCPGYARDVLSMYHAACEVGRVLKKKECAAFCRHLKKDFTVLVLVLLALSFAGGLLGVCPLPEVSLVAFVSALFFGRQFAGEVLARKFSVSEVAAYFGNGDTLNALKGRLRIDVAQEALAAVSWVLMFSFCAQFLAGFGAWVKGAVK